MSHSTDFIARSREALRDAELQLALNKARSGFVEKRRKAVEQIANFDAMRAQAKAVREKSLANLDTFLIRFEKNVIARGGHVHWARTPEEMRQIVVDLCRRHQVKQVSKGKSMVGEEVLLNEALEAAGINPIETDLGEYILQIAREKPSHIVTPALHKTQRQIADLFLREHDLGKRELKQVEEIVNEARAILRQKFLSADAGITGANILIADTGTTVLVTNEGNGDLSANLPKTHIVTTSIEKVVETWGDASAILRVLARSATGQNITAYTSFFTGPKTAHDRDGPENFHIVLLDNRRSEILGGEFRDMLRCIRCAACMNHCPVYQSVGGHSYNSVYPGPMGAVLTPLLFKDAGRQDDQLQLANASTLCGRCEEVCPVQIPLPELLRKLRNKERIEVRANITARLLNNAFCFVAKRPRLYRTVTAFGIGLLRRLGGSGGSFSSIPMMKAWTKYKDFPSPEKSTFQELWQNRKKNGNGK